ncbi:MAG: SMC-Scp complex subunit ScpB [Chloroflexota bacterium]|jgi:segregation and condensation protein B
MSNIQSTNLTLLSQLEALIFASPAALSANSLAKILDLPTPQIEKGLEELEAEYTQRGFRLQHHQGRYQLTSAPEAASLIESMLGLETGGRLSNAALEALAVIAYQHSVTRPQIDAIRGVNSDGVIKSLLNKGLIEEVGRAETPGRPLLYSVTAEFLQYFGLNSVEDLPALEKQSGLDNDNLVEGKE